jgi:hypothetical protein
MTAELIPFPVRQGNGAREALIEIYLISDHSNAEEKADAMLTLLWYYGYKLVRVDGSE